MSHVSEPGSAVEAGPWWIARHWAIFRGTVALTRLAGERRRFWRELGRKTAKLLARKRVEPADLEPWRARLEALDQREAAVWDRLREIILAPER